MFKPETEVFERLHSDVNLLNTLNPIHKENANHTVDKSDNLNKSEDASESNTFPPNSDENTEHNNLGESIDSESPLPFPSSAPLPSSFDIPIKDAELECAEVIPDDEAAQILERALNGNTDKVNKLGRPKGSREKSTNERADFGMLAAVLGTGKAAQALGISAGQTSLNLRGLTTHGKPKDIDLTTQVKERLGKIQDVASRKLLSTLELINEEEIEAITDVEKQTRVGMNLARILEKAMPREEEAKDITQFIIVKPEVKTEAAYDVIDV